MRFDTLLAWHKTHLRPAMVANVGRATQKVATQKVSDTFFNHIAIGINTGGCNETPQRLSTVGGLA